MKIRDIYVWAAAMLLATGCEWVQDDLVPEQGGKVLQAAAVPQYSVADFGALLCSPTPALLPRGGCRFDEEGFVARTELVGYALARWLGEHADLVGLEGSDDLSRVLPCNETLLGNDGILRVLGEAAGTDAGTVAGEMGGYVRSLVYECPAGMYGAEGLMEQVGEALVHEGVAYDLHTRYGPVVETGAGKVFVSHGVGFETDGYKAYGFLCDLEGDVVSREVLSLGDAVGLGMVLLEAWPVVGTPGVGRYNDPCWEGYVYGGGGSGGGGSGGDLDDDGAAKNVVNGPMVTPLPEYDQCGSNVKDGLRVVRFHLADRNEGGLFTGRSEVYLSASVWVDGDLFSIRTNSEGDHSVITIDANKVCSVSEGKELARVSASDIGPNTSVIITPPQNRDWTIINAGFCRHGGYDRCKVTIYEHDPIPGTEFYKSMWHEEWGGADTCVAHFCPTSFYNDTWFSNNSFVLTPDDFTNNNDHLYLVEVPGGFQKWNFQPGNQYSWFEVELY